MAILTNSYRPAVCHGIGTDGDRSASACIGIIADSHCRIFIGLIDLFSTFLKNTHRRFGIRADGDTGISRHGVIAAGERILSEALGFIADGHAVAARFHRFRTVADGHAGVLIGTSFRPDCHRSYRPRTVIIGVVNIIRRFCQVGTLRIDGEIFHFNVRQFTLVRFVLDGVVDRAARHNTGISVSDLPVRGNIDSVCFYTCFRILCRLHSGIRTRGNNNCTFGKVLDNGLAFLRDIVQILVRFLRIEHFELRHVHRVGVFRTGGKSGQLTGFSVFLVTDRHCAGC